MKTIRSPLVVPVTRPEIIDGKLVVDDQSRILSCGKWDRHVQGELIRWDGLVIPGLVNAHVHLELSALRGRIPKRVGVTNWVQKMQAERVRLDGTEIDSAIRAGVTAMVDDGIVAIGEVGNEFRSLPWLRPDDFRVCYFYEILGFLSHLAESIFSDALDKLEQVRKENPWFSFFLCPHALYSVSKPLIRMIFAHQALGITSIHLAEGREETELLATGGGPWKDYLERLGKWPSQWRFPAQSPVSYFQTLALDQRAILVHLCQIVSDEIVWLREQEKLIPCCCPRSNLHITGAPAPMDQFWRAGIPVALGTDSLASNDSLSIQMEMKAVKINFPALPDEAVLAMATLNGARALGLETEIGSLDPGKRPGILLVESNSLRDFLTAEAAVRVRRI